MESAGWNRRTDCAEPPHRTDYAELNCRVDSSGLSSDVGTAPELHKAGRLSCFLGSEASQRAGLEGWDVVPRHVPPQHVLPRHVPLLPHIGQHIG